jgi:hypothetical protein
VRCCGCTFFLLPAKANQIIKDFFFFLSSHLSPVGNHHFFFLYVIVCPVLPPTLTFLTLFFWSVICFFSISFCCVASH